MSEVKATCTPEVADFIDPTGALRKSGLLSVLPEQYKVMINGKDSGIIESNFKHAAPYWSQRQMKTGLSIRLVKIV